MGQTIVEKLAQAHMAEGPARPLRPGDVVSLRPRHVLTHDNTSAVLKKFRSLGATKVMDPRQPVFALDHDIQNRTRENLAKYWEIEAFARDQGVDFYPAGAGIGHQMMVSMGYVLPGALVVASDSHSNMYGALGALGTPVVRTDAAGIWATGDFWWQIPRTVRVVLEGALPPGVTGKDVIITLCGLYNHEEVLNAALEFAGPGVAALSMDERLTIANMSTEWGALTGWFPVDDVTLAYLRERKGVLDGGACAVHGAHVPNAAGGPRITDEDLARWDDAPPTPDADAVYAGEIVLDLGDVSPRVSGPDTVQVMRSVAEMEKERVAVDKAYLVSCVNSRLEDLQAAAAVLEGRKVADGVTFYVAAASHEVQEAAKSSSAWGTLMDAGAHPLPPGCGPCIGLGDGLLEPGEVGISATNRNFKGRMGSRDAVTYLASPAVVAASAAAGYISAPRTNGGTATLSDAGAAARKADLTPHFREMQTPEGAPDETVDILEGFPRSVRGRLVLVPKDNLNTDGIYGKDYTYRESMTREDMARVVMENYDPTFTARAQEGDILVGGFNFGTGSSREQAATALQAKGIAVVVAGSFSQTYLRNAYNNGLPCIECPALVGALREELADKVASGEATVIPGDEIAIDFSTGTITYRDRPFRFPTLGTVPQALVVAGGSENLIKQRLGLTEPEG
ncbi:MAG: homoaconitase [Gemmatimonadetes bacterium]|nr:homoaconitase [Gemmatimonadota bacterium]